MEVSGNAWNFRSYSQKRSILFTPCFLAFCWLHCNYKGGTWNSNFRPRDSDILWHTEKQDKKTLHPPNLEGALSVLKCLVHILLFWVSLLEQLKVYSARLCLATLQYAKAAGLFVPSVFSSRHFPPVPSTGFHTLVIDISPSRSPALSMFLWNVVS